MREPYRVAEVGGCKEGKERTRKGLEIKARVEVGQGWEQYHYEGENDEGFCGKSRPPP